MTRDEEDIAWLDDGRANGWVLPDLGAPGWAKRSPARHVRFAWHLWRANSVAVSWASVGVGLGDLTAYDRWVLYAILRGWV